MNHIKSAIQNYPPRILVLGYDNYCGSVEPEDDPERYEFTIYPVSPEHIKVMRWSQRSGTVSWLEFCDAAEVIDLIEPYEANGILSKFELTNIDHNLADRFA
jgi:hypothetical protein